MRIESSGKFMIEGFLVLDIIEVDRCVECPQYEGQGDRVFLIFHGVLDGGMIFVEPGREKAGLHKTLIWSKTSL